MPEDKLREALAAYAHELWSGWMKYMSSKVISSHETVDMNKDGKVGGWLPIGLRDRWARQMNTPYAELPESEKELDRAEADKIIAILDDHIDEELAEIAKERLEDAEEDEYSAALKELERIGWPCRLRELPGLYEELARKQLEDKRESEGVGIGNLAAVRMGNPAEVPPYAKRKVEKVPSLIAAPQLKRDVEE